MVDLESAEKLAETDVVAVAATRDVLHIDGADSASYLHGQLSQDVEGLGVGESSYTLLLQPQGKVDAWMRMYRVADQEFLLDVEPGFGATAKERLERFRLRVDVTIELATVPMLALRGPGAGAAVSTAVTAPSVVVLDAAWGPVSGLDLIDVGAEGDVDPTTWVDETIVVGPTETLDLLRVRAGRPAMGPELDESTIPAAAGIVDRSVDFTKGCYVGQELVARVDSRGNNTPTRLYGLRFDGPTTAVSGSELQLDGGVAGTVTSVATSPELGPIGLAYLKRAVEVPATLLVAGPEGRAQSVEAVELPFR